MIYRVSAYFKPELAAEYLTKFTDGTINSERRDDSKIVDAMNSVVVTVTLGDW